MAEPSRNALTETGIPNGLNRIKTRRVATASKEKERRSAGIEDFDKLIESPNSARPHVKQKHNRVLGKGQVMINSPREGLKTKKIAKLFTSHLSKDFDQTVGKFSQQPESSDCHNGESRGAMKNVRVKQCESERTGSHKMHKSLKSFSHELGPKGGILSVNPRPRSFSDLKELLGSLHSRFDATKEVVNTELACFSKELLEVLQGNDSLSLDGRRMVEQLLVLAKKCIKMSTKKFRTKCEKIVQDLTIKRQQCQAGLLKWLLTRMLFILTRCTRLLHFEMDAEPADGKPLHKVQKCLERIPSVEVNWFVNQDVVGSESGHSLTSKNGPECNLQEADDANLLSRQNQHRSEMPVGMCSKDFTGTGVTGQSSPSKGSFGLPNDQELDEFGYKFNGKQTNRKDSSTFKDQDQFVDDSNLVICRICEELVPIVHLESHSYICAYADKCDSNNLDVNERLLRLADLLEQLVDSRSLITQDTDDSLDHTRMQSTDSAVVSDVSSPKVNEPRYRGVEGMFEDLHEMDTAGIEDFQLTSFINSRGYLGSKLNLCGPPSSAGSMTSASSTNTPRAGSFDVFWLDQNNSNELEDATQMADLADIARCVAGTDLSEQGSNEFLLACMEDLQDILQSSKLKALVVDTFGGRIENLLREKFIVACNLVDAKSDIQHPESAKMMLDNVSQSSAVSTPSHPSHKDRISIDDFEIIKPISKGAFGKVYLARKRTTGDLFAIKVLKKVDMLRKNDIDRIVAERNILIAVRNPFVVRFFYSFTSKDHLYLVMEYLNGGDLYSLLQKVGSLEEDIARIYISELVLALEYLHSLGIVHRDLKPDNILIAHDGHIKLTDFGLSKIGLMNSTSDLSRSETKECTVSDSQTSESMDRTQRSAVGTPDYLAPEILLGTQHGYAVDWWSVGIILFELITGFPPFTAEFPEVVNDPIKQLNEVIFDNILNRFIPWPSIPDEMSTEAQDLIERFLDHDPDQRLGVKGASEVKAHPFFRGVDWDNLTMQKAVFVPQPESHDDTSYFVSRYNSIELENDGDSSDSASDASDLCSTSGLEKLDEFGDLAEFSSPLDLSLINFSFKNLSQLASINHDVLLQGGKDSSKCSSPST